MIILGGSYYLSKNTKQLNFNKKYVILAECLYFYPAGAGVVFEGGGAFCLVAMQLWMDSYKR